MNRSMVAILCIIVGASCKEDAVSEKLNDIGVWSGDPSARDLSSHYSSSHYSASHTYAPGPRVVKWSGDYHCDSFCHEALALIFVVWILIWVLWLIFRCWIAPEHWYWWCLCGEIGEPYLRGRRSKKYSQVDDMS